MSWKKRAFIELQNLAATTPKPKPRKTQKARKARAKIEETPRPRREPDELIW
jgi:hypothetical protein